MKKLLYCLLLIFFYTHCYSQGEWELKKNEDGIKVYTRKTNKSSVKEFKAVMVLNTSITTLVDKITDAKRLKYWNYKTTKSKLLKRVSDSVFVVYMYNDFPWPVKNRDHISKLSLLKTDSSIVRINITSLPKYIPKHEDAIRIEKFSGYWLLEKIDKGIRVTQQMHGEPKGNVPSIIINATLAKAPLYSFKTLKQQLSH
jgi:hypothetical protein